MLNDRIKGEGILFLYDISNLIYGKTALKWKHKVFGLRTHKLSLKINLRTRYF
jgi:hypothetical protein